MATYADSCMRGVCSIWSLERRRGGEGRGERVLTVAIDASRVMVEARGFANRVPTEQEKGLLERWMRDAGVKPGPYLYGW